MFVMWVSVRNDLLVVLAKRVVKELALGDTLLHVGMMAWGMASTT
jgi:hypothetical protein